MDKQTESREQFEAWMAGKFSRPDLMLRRLPDGGYSSHYIDMRWEAWKASRESLVVAMPKREAFESYPHESYMIDDEDGKYIAYAETVDALQAIGIRIKGEGV